MKRKTFEPTLGNVLQLFNKRVNDFKGESKRSYQKAFSSFQIYVITHYNQNERFSGTIIGNWVIWNILEGLTIKTIIFYLEKISSLYTKTAHNLDGGKLPIFKEIKNKLQLLSDTSKYFQEIKNLSKKFIGDPRVKNKQLSVEEFQEALKMFNTENHINNADYLWACLALNSRIPSDMVIGMIGHIPEGLDFLNLTESRTINEEEKQEIQNKICNTISGESEEWFAMRLRPKVSFEKMLERFAKLSPDTTIPELFYPHEEIAKMVGRKIIWSGRPVIKDVIFFKMKKSKIYSLFNQIYDLAWCYKNPGNGIINYAAIPKRAMDDFKKALGMLSPDFEIAPVGSMSLKPGDEVIIVNGEYARQKGLITKDSSSDNSNKIFRVSLMTNNGRWDIGIDARLLKKM